MEKQDADDEIRIDFFIRVYYAVPCGFMWF